MRAIHERTLVICMIETRAGLENVDAIAAVDGVDVIWLGHFDLTNFLGIPGQFSHPQYRDAVKRIADAASKHGKAAGYMAADAELGREYLGHGYRMIATGTDQGFCKRHWANCWQVGETPDLPRRRHERHPRLARRAGVRPGAVAGSRCNSSGNGCRAACGKSPPSMPRLTTRST